MVVKSESRNICLKLYVSFRVKVKMAYLAKILKKIAHRTLWVYRHRISTIIFYIGVQINLQTNDIIAYLVII